jgi:hypothetical protein
MFQVVLVGEPDSSTRVEKKLLRSELPLLGSNPREETKKNAPDDIFLDRFGAWSQYGGG